MGLWGVIGKALNSTVKTNDCVPLDKLMSALKSQCVSEVIAACEAKAPVSANKISGEVYMAEKTVASITGKGTAVIGLDTYSTNDVISLTVDGNEIITNVTPKDILIMQYSAYELVFRFNKSFVLKAKGSSASTPFVISGIVYFEE